MTAPTPPPVRRSLAPLIDRLYVLWIASSLLMVLLVIVLTVLGGGRLRRQAERISEQSLAIDELRAELAEARRELDRLANRETVGLRAGSEPAAIPEKPARAAPPVAPEELREAERTEPEPPVDAASQERDVAALLQAALRTDGESHFELADRAAAEEALLAASRARLDGATYVRLALVARLLDRDPAAEMLAARALEAGEFPAAYYETSARMLLARGRAAESLVYATRLLAGRPDDPDALLLLAEAHDLRGDPAAVDRTLEALAQADRLTLDKKLRMGRLFVKLERWDRLEALVTTVEWDAGAVPPGLDFLRGVLASQRGELPEALAILDNLVADQPGDYEFQTWRGVVLLEARQFEAAREAFAAVQDQPDRPEAWYWRGVLELRAGNPDEAVRLFQHALAASQRYAPAWEALGTMALNGGDLSAALQNLTNAVNANPRRGSAHFLTAVIHAKLGHPAETAGALRRAFELDPALVDAAGKTEVIVGLFTPAELVELAGSADAADRPN